MTKDLFKVKEIHNAFILIEGDKVSSYMLNHPTMNDKTLVQDIVKKLGLKDRLKVEEK